MSEREGEIKMLITKKMLLALALGVAIVGAGVGALITHSANSSTQAASTNSTPSYDATASTNQTQRSPEDIASTNASQFKTSEEQTAYKQGYDDGYTGCTNAEAGTSTRSVAYSSAPAVRYSNGRRVYYDYSNERHGRSFWQKHRDKLTVAMGSGAGALVGGLIGGKRGAGIGLLGGGAGSALYTYKLRHRSRRY